MRLRLKRFGTIALASLLVACTSPGALTSSNEGKTPDWAVVVHGGAGVITRESMTTAQELAYREALTAALQTGADVLSDGRPALDAVEAIIRNLEDDPLFNAGRGSVLTEEGGFSLDASIMDGKTLDAGAVAGLSNVRHPITAARKVIDDSPHVMLAGEGADEFAAQQGLEVVDPAFFFTERRWKSLLKTLQDRGVEPPVRPVPASPDTARLHVEGEKFGTVGVVALDRNGNLAAGTSTGGTTAKRWGRVGDSPVLGAGTWADNDSCAVSATGTGEYFIRLAVARTICALVEFEGVDTKAAADRVILGDLTDLGGDGGVIVLATDGRPVWSFNTEGMYRAHLVSDGEPVVEIFGAD